MMRTIKKKIKNWKFLGMTTVTGIFFFVVACQEQVMTEVTNTVQSSTMALEIPPQVSDQIAKMEKENPGSKVIALELNDEGKKSLKKIEEQQGLPTSMNVMTIQDKDFEKNGLVRTYAVVVYNGQAQKLADLAKTDDNIYTVVEESAMPEGGIGAFYEIIQKNLKYPVEARTNRVEGKIFVEFVVQTDGSLSDLKILKGLGHGLDEEALRVVKLSPKWTPGKHQGIIVKQRMVLPLSFRLGGLEKSSYRETTNPENSLSEIVAIGYIRQ